MRYSFDGIAPRISAKAYVSDSAVIIGDVSIDEGCYIGPGAIIRGDDGFIEICKEAAVEDGVIIHATPHETCRIGKRVTLGHGAIIHSSVDDYAVIGMTAVVSLGAYVGSWSIVGEGSVVKMNQIIEPRVVVVGAPAKVVRPLEERDIAYWKEGKQAYVTLASRCLKGAIKALD